MVVVPPSILQNVQKNRPSATIFASLTMPQPPIIYESPPCEFSLPAFPEAPSADTGVRAQTSAPNTSRDAVIRRPAGNSQDGIQSAGAFLARLAGRSAQEVMTYT